MYLYVAFRFNVNDNLLLCLKQVCSLKYKTINTVVLHVFIWTPIQRGPELSLCVL